MNFTICNFAVDSKVELLNLYQEVALKSGGIIRLQEEITSDYIDEFCSKSSTNGIQLIAKSSNEQLIGEIHAYSYGISAFRHILGDITIVVHPEYQGKGVGKELFLSLLEKVKEERKDILRLELFVRSESVKTVDFYKKLGFIAEGHFKHRILNKNNKLETPLAMVWYNPEFRRESD